MNKLKYIIPLLLVALVLNGASCGGGKKSTDSEEEEKEEKTNVEKKLTRDQMKNVLLKTAADLGWSETDVKSAGSQGYELKKVYVKGEDKSKSVILAITEVSDSDLSSILSGTNRKTFIKEYCEILTDYEEGRGGRTSDLIEISGFDACHTIEYMSVWGDLKDCLGHSDTMSVIGHYWLQVISNALDERGEVCDATDSLPIAEILVNNLLEAF